MRCSSTIDPVKLNRHHDDLFSYRPERLVVSGLRCTMAGYDLGDPECWNCLWDIYVAEIGSATTRRLMGELQYWIRGVRSAADHSLTYYPMGCRHVCRDECLLLSLLSALQHKDEGCTDCALRALCTRTDKMQVQSIRDSSRAFASALLDAGEVLLPVPLPVLQTIVNATRQQNQPVPPLAERN